MGIWSSGMILALDARDPELDSRNAPLPRLTFYCFNMAPLNFIPTHIYSNQDIMFWIGAVMIKSKLEHRSKMQGWDSAYFHYPYILLVFNTLFTKSFQEPQLQGEESVKYVCQQQGIWSSGVTLALVLEVQSSFNEMPLFF